MDAREQLLQTLMQDLQNFQTPERYSAEQQAQIMNGRKGQADIDAGRAAIAENERLYQEALTKRGELQTRIGTLSNEIDTAKGTARKQGQEDFERSPAGQAYDVGKIAAPVG